MSRIKRRNRSDIQLKHTGGPLDLVDNVIKLVYRINDEEYDFIAERLTALELAIFTNDNPSFGEKRQQLILVEQYLIQFTQLPVPEEGV